MTRDAEGRPGERRPDGHSATATTLTVPDWANYATAHRWVRDVARPRWPHATTNDVVWALAITLWAGGRDD